MCDAHQFVFDVDKAFADQLVTVLEASPEHPITANGASRKCGIYVLYRAPDKQPVYVGQAVSETGISGRLRDHTKKNRTPLRYLFERDDVPLSSNPRKMGSH